MKIAVVHPYKHHVYNSMAGVIDSGAEVIGMLGYYNNDDIIDKIMNKTKYKELIEGYKYNKIEKNIKTNLFIKILYLLNKLLSNRIEKIYLFLFQIWCILNLKNIDCIHVLQDYCNLIIRYAKKHNIIIVYEQITAYDIPQFITEKTNIDLDKKLLKQKENLLYADFIMLPSNFVKESIINHLPLELIEDKIRMIPYGADINNFKYKIRKFNKNRKLELLIVASISKRKGIEYLIKAMNILKEKVNLNYIGASKSNELELYQELKRCNNINYIGTVPHSKIAEYFEKSDIFILPSLAEGSSLSVYEALASGMPCIVTENVGSVITNSFDGIIIETKDVSSIVSSIETFINSPELVENMSKNSKETLSKFSWSNYEYKISQFYIHNITEKGIEI